MMSCLKNFKTLATKNEKYDEFFVEKNSIKTKEELKKTLFSFCPMRKMIKPPSKEDENFQRLKAEIKAEAQGIFYFYISPP